MSINLRDLGAISDSINVQIFYESGTWVKPRGTLPSSCVEIYLWGAGGGGAIRRSTLAFTAHGGGGGQFATFFGRGDDLDLEEPVIVGAGGLGGESISSTAIFVGADGGNTEFKGCVAIGGRGSLGNTNNSSGAAGDSAHLTTPIGIANLNLRIDFLRGLSSRSGNGVGGNDANSILGGPGGGASVNSATTNQSGGRCYGFANRTDPLHDPKNPPLFGPGNGGDGLNQIEIPDYSILDGGRCAGGGSWRRGTTDTSETVRAGNGGDGIALIITRI